MPPPRLGWPNMGSRDFTDDEAEEILFAALQRPRAQRAALLDDRCGERHTLRREIESLLAAHERAGGFIDPFAGGSSEVSAGGRVCVGDRVGAFRLVDVIATGGMGTVFRAARVEGDFTQHVAIKFIGSWIRDPLAAQRFRAERQILATLQHPHIVSLLDGGVRDDGEAYLVMEYVDGVPITIFGETHALSLNQRLGLFTQVCSAVQFAHAHSIVHRDLKPANIVVTPDGVVKVLDFGVAKLLEPSKAAGGTTGVLPVPFTPNYASPEQLRGLPVTTASDVYALGVLLYELLSGARPYETAGKPLDEVLAIVLESDPPPPSASRHDGRSLPYLPRTLMGDLDAIVSMAMRKDAARRYLSAADLAEDIARCLRGLPVVAQPDRALYRAAKFVRRHRIAVAGVAATILALTTGLTAGLFWRTGTPVPLPAETTASDRRVMIAILPFEDLSADVDQRYLSDGLTEELIAEFGRLAPTRLGIIARTSAMAYKATAKSVAEIAGELGVDFIFEGTVRREGDRVRIVVHLVRTSDQAHVWSERYDRDLGSMLSLQIEVARAIAGETRVRLSEAEVARLGRTANVHPDALQAYLKGRFFLNQRTREGLEKALQQFEQAIAINPQYAQAHSGIADAHELFASYASVPPLESLERGMKAALRALELDPELADAHTSLGTVHLSYAREWDRAEQAYVRAIELNPSSALAHNRYAELLSYLGRHDQAIAEAKRAIALDPASLLMNANLGIIYQRARRYDEAAEQIRQTLSMDANYLLGHLDSGLINAARGSFEEAVAAFQRASTLAPDYADLHALLGYAYARAGRVGEARVVGAQLRRLVSERYVSGYVLALYHLGLGERDQALSQLERAYEDRSWLVMMMNVDPLLDPLRADPRFQALLQRLKFPQQRGGGLTSD